MVNQNNEKVAKIMKIRKIAKLSTKINWLTLRGVSIYIFPVNKGLGGFDSRKHIQHIFWLNSFWSNFSQREVNITDFQVYYQSSEKQKCFKFVCVFLILNYL